MNKNIKLNLKKKNETEDIKKRTAQQWMPISDIKDYVVYRKDNCLLGFIRIMPINISLLSKQELKNLIRQHTEVYSSIQHKFQIFSIGRPVDLSNYLEWLSTIQKQETNFLKKRLLNQTIQHSAYLSASGEIVERRYYFILPLKDKTDAEALQIFEDTVKLFNSGGFKTNLCNYDDIMDLLLLFAQPTQTTATIEKKEFDFSYAPILDI